MEQRTLNRIKSRCDVFDNFSPAMKIVFTEIALCCDNQGFYPKNEWDFTRLERIIVKNSFELEDSLALCK